jgi:YidC/Oxa1 family membrane protein insertase
LEKTLDLGFFAKITHPLLSGLHFLNNLVRNWGLAIIILTLLLKLLFYPLTRQAAISMNKMKKLQPEMNKIREKYKDEPQKMQQEIMRFMSVHKVNPMKGCLPILPQIPVFFAFYRVLSTSIELRHAPFFGWIHDLSSADPFYITPLLLGVAMFLQQKLTPTAGLDKAQERIMMLLPIFFTVMMLTLPAGMVIYMLTNTIVSVAQQQWLNRRLQ